MPVEAVWPLEAELPRSLSGGGEGEATVLASVPPPAPVPVPPPVAEPVDGGGEGGGEGSGVAGIGGGGGWGSPGVGGELWAISVDVATFATDWTVTPRSVEMRYVLTAVRALEMRVASVLEGATIRAATMVVAAWRRRRVEVPAVTVRVMSSAATPELPRTVLSVE